MTHVVLLGDSIFDNAAYVPNEPDVTEQLRRILPTEWTASLLAIDGALITDVADQLGRVPAEATHFIVSCGGNDALEYSAVLNESVSTVAAALDRLADLRGHFRAAYRGMLQQVLASGRSVTVCTVYDSVPGLGPAELTALSMFNEIILREAVAQRVDIIDLRIVCEDVGDYSSLSPIEPSYQGGGKIARAIRSCVLGTGTVGQSITVRI